MNFIEKLPEFYRDSKLVNSIQNAFSLDRDILESEVVDLIDQLFIDTATWGLRLWEEFAQIPINTELSIDIRRSRLKAKITRFIPALHEEQLINLIKHYFSSVEIKDYPRENRFDVFFGTETEIGPNLNYAIEDIEEIKPAHLAFNIVLNYIRTLSIKSSFNRNASEELNYCGTLVASEQLEKFDSVIGASKESSLEKYKFTYLSELIEKCSEELFIHGDGKRLINEIEDINNFIKSDEFKYPAETNFIEADCKEIITILNSFNIDTLSENFKIASDKISVGEED